MELFENNIIWDIMIRIKNLLTIIKQQLLCIISKLASILKISIIFKICSSEFD